MVVCLHINSPFFRSFRGIKLGKGCRESSFSSLVTASLWGLGRGALPTADATLPGLSSSPRMTSCAARVTGVWSGQTCDRLITQTHHRLTHHSRTKMQRFWLCRMRAEACFWHLLWWHSKTHYASYQRILIQSQSTFIIFIHLADAFSLSALID